MKMFLDGFSITKNQGPGVCEQILVKASVSSEVFLGILVNVDSAPGDLNFFAWFFAWKLQPGLLHRSVLCSYY